MEKRALFISLILVLMLLFGCVESEDLKEPNKTIKEDEISELSLYFPIKENTRYIYEGFGNEYADYEVNVPYIEDNKFQRMVDNGGTVVSEIIEVSEKEIARLYSRPEAYYRENLIRKEILDYQKKEDRDVLLKAPLEVGNSWKTNDDRKRTITDLAAEISVLDNTYEAIEVTTESDDNGKFKEYYVKDIGLVKSVFTMDDMIVSSTLNKIQKDHVLSQNIRFFYPNIEDGKLDYKDQQVKFKTNDITRNIIEKDYKETLKQTNTLVLTENTKINSLYLNDNGMVYIDLSGDFLKEMNAGSGYESMILDSLATTFGHYYGVDKVILTIDEKNYESGHILLEKGDYLNVNKEALLLE